MSKIKDRRLDSFFRDPLFKCRPDPLFCCLQGVRPVRAILHVVATVSLAHCAHGRVEELGNDFESVFTGSNLCPGSRRRSGLRMDCARVRSSRFKDSMTAVISSRAWKYAQLRDGT